MDRDRSRFDDATIRWARREIVPRLVEALAPERIDLFDPPGRPADAESHPPGLLVVASRFAGVPVAQRVEITSALLAGAAPVRPLCLTPDEFALAERVPGPVLAAARSGVRLV